MKRKMNPVICNIKGKPKTYKILLGDRFKYNAVLPVATREEADRLVKWSYGRIKTN